MSPGCGFLGRANALEFGRKLVAKRAGGVEVQQARGGGRDGSCARAADIAITAESAEAKIGVAHRLGSPSWSAPAGLALMPP